MSSTWGPGLEAEASYRREQLMSARGTRVGHQGRGTGRRGTPGWSAWTLLRHRSSGATPS